MNRFVLVCHLLVCVFNTNAWCIVSDRIFFDHLSEESGLSHIGINAITQDSRGFIWIGTYDGLNRYDGVNVRVFRNQTGDARSLVNNRVYSMVETFNGFLWIGTEEGVCVYDPVHETFFIPEPFESIGNNLHVTTLFEDSRRRLWILSSNNIHIYDLESKSLNSVYYRIFSGITTIFLDIKESGTGYFFLATNTGLVTISPNIEIVENDFRKSIYIRSFDIMNDSILWLGTQNGLILANIKSIDDELIQIESIDKKIDNHIISNVLIDQNENVWVGLLYDGLRKVTLNEDGTYNIYAYHNNPEKLKTLCNNKISSLYEDRQGILWIGSSENGISKYNPFSYGFTLFNQLNTGDFGLKSDYILSLVRYNEKLVVGTKDNGAYVMDLETGIFIKPDYNLEVLRDLSVSSLYVDSRNILWVGTWRGLYCLLPGETELKWVSTGFNAIYDICEDDFGGIWIGSRSGLVRLSIDVDTWVITTQIVLLDFKKDRNETLSIRKLYKDPFDQIIWIGTWYHGLIQLFLDEETIRNGNFKSKQYSKNNKDQHSLKSNFITSILRINENELWLGTEHGGLSHGKFIHDSLYFTNYDTFDGLSNNVVKAILYDGRTNLWISTNNGINKFSIDSQQFEVFNKSHDLSSSFFTNAAVQVTDQLMIMGGNQGFYMFNPNRIYNDTIAPIPNIGSFQLLYQVINPGQELNDRVIHTKSITNTDVLNLIYKQNTFSFEMQALQFSNPFKNRFKYILHGFDEEWIYSREGEFFANYTRIKPGKYKFEFYAANSTGLWSPESKSIDLIIHPPFWQTRYAYLFYGLIIITVLYYSFKTNMRIITLKHNIEIEKIEAYQNKTITEEKLKFFMNVSHEFKTPITLILGPLQWLSTYFAKDELAISYLSIIKNQANYLKDLLEQLIYFRKAESATLTLKCQYQDIVVFMHKILEFYRWQAKEQSINVKYIHPNTDVFLWFDPKKMEKVFHNLLSNALKFTNQNGNITIHIYGPDQNKLIHISVKDSGMGISNENIQHIFTRFYQVNSWDGGYGIGLSLAKSLVDLHKGNISVNSKVGKGSEFIVSLRSGTNHLLPDQMNGCDISKDREVEKTDYTQTWEPCQKENDMQCSQKENNIKKPLILIVEDNLHMMSFLKKILNKNYELVTAKNGKEGLELMNTNLPELIISDVMMPEMDGISLCNKVKTDLLTCHIPVVLLTAKNEIIDSITGLNQGADYYLSKPFDIQLLITVVESLLKNRDNLKKKISLNLPFDLSSEKIHSPDNDLLNKIHKVIEVHYSDPDFNSNQFCKKLYINRSYFYIKMKELINQTPSEFIRSYRLKKAVEFMVKEKIPVTEVYYKVGFLSRAYFTKCFKETYGKSPSEFLKWDIAIDV